MAIKAQRKRKRRSCGSCTACCTVLGVPELEKEPYIRCPWVCEKGCEFYSARPLSCKGYKCGWLSGRLGPKDRPDQLGAILEDQDSNFGETSVFKQASRDAWARKELRQRINHEAKSRIVYLVTLHKNLRYIVCPADKVGSVRAQFVGGGGQAEHVASRIEDLPI